MKKNIKYIIFSISLLVVITLNINTVRAINYFSIATDATRVNVGQTVKLTVYFDTYESGLSISSSNNSVLSGGVEEEWIDKSSYVTYFTAKSAGTATIYVNTKNGTTMENNNETDMNFSRSISITVISNQSTNGSSNTNIDINKIYSKNNYLSNLVIDGYELTPNFDKETSEYKVTLEPGTEKINIITNKEDESANVKGAGEIEVSEGINTIEIVVVAENGNERIYTILATVEEKDPIKVKIDGNTYTVVKKKELIGTKDGYIEKSVKINNFDIPTLYNEVTNVTLLGLKDESGNIKLYSYNSRTGEYNEYNEFTFDLMNLYVHEDKKSSYKKVEININNIDVVAYELEGLNDYYLLYATNTSTGYEGYYLYDKVENSVQRYDTAILDRLTHEKDKYLSLVLVLSCVCFLAMLFLLVEVNRDNKRKNEE